MITKRNVAIFLIHGMVLGLLDQLQIFSQLYIIELPGLSTGLDFGRAWHAGLLHKLKSCGISGQIFGLISSFLINRWLRMLLVEKSLQEYPVNAGLPQGSILRPTLFSAIH